MARTKQTSRKITKAADAKPPRNESIRHKAARKCAPITTKPDVKKQKKKANATKGRKDDSEDASSQSNNSDEMECSN